MRNLGTGSIQNLGTQPGSPKRAYEETTDVVGRFEDKFARLVGAKYAVAVNSATSGLVATMLALLPHAGGGVVTSPMTFSATGNAILAAGGIPIFADVGRQTFCINGATVARRVSQGCRGVLAVDLYGYPAVDAGLMEFCQKKDLFIVEDAAQALGSLRSGRRVGGISDATVFSFFESKHLALGEGGMVTTNNEEFAERLRMIRSHGQDRQYHQVVMGFNFRLPAKLAYDGLNILDSAESIIARRVEVGRVYHETLSGAAKVTLPLLEHNVVCSYYRYPLIIRLAASKLNRLLELISQRCGVTIGRGYGTLVYQQPFYRDLRKHFWGAQVMSFPRYSNWSCPDAEYIVERVVELPTGPALSDEDAMRVGSVLKEVLKNC